MPTPGPRDIRDVLGEIICLLHTVVVTTAPSDDRINADHVLNALAIAETARRIIPPTNSPIQPVAGERSEP